MYNYLSFLFLVGIEILILTKLQNRLRYFKFYIFLIILSILFYLVYA